ncbi:hypothetical protein KIW84_074437 [Lathyrus oleraceus]|uniref:SAM-dependent methyltransferase RsmB-F/NOP2-type catalytic core domain-containing protein n=2 Tax=Pisum sativum TaxID=3888 RepID=A0A9D4VU47_PEA|nr:hypothetical protein KIW84_074437 [Pisum sativum]
MLALGLIGINKFGTALVLLCKCHATITSLSVVDTHKRSLSEEFNFEYMAVHVPKSNTATFHFFTKKLRYNNDAEEENAYVIRKQLKIYDIDASSGAAVMALGISPGDHVLDLCAAPGAKLCMILDLLGDSGSVTGVDAARHQLAACRTMLQKYKLGDRCRLFVADGTTFSVIPEGFRSDSESYESRSEERMDVFKEWTSRRPWKERKKAKKCATPQVVSKSHPPELIYYGQHSGVIGLTKGELYKTVAENEIAGYGYDKVLVDAECTHDGSVKHIQKFEHWGWVTLQRRVLDAERTDNLHALQAKTCYSLDL